MFQHSTTRSGLTSAVATLELIYHNTVRGVRASNGNAVMALVMNMIQAMIFVAAFYVMFTVLGLRGAALRGDFLLYIMSGIFLFMTHNRGLSSVLGAESSTSPMMKHAPMNTAIAIISAALSGLYVQILSLMMVLLIYHCAVAPIFIPDPVMAFAMLLLAWLSGCSIGLVLLALKPWMPGVVSLFSTIYQRANMIASGKMFVANTLPSSMLAMFDWNPLFHSIDQARGFMFLNYNPHNSSISYPLTVCVILITVGLLGEFYTRQYNSLSWTARR